MAYQSHEFYVARAFELARQGYDQGGCPIGGVLVDNATGQVLGQGHNRMAARLRAIASLWLPASARKTLRNGLKTGAEDPIPG